MAVMAKFDPQKIPISEEDTQSLLQKVLSAEEIIRRAHFDDWRTLLRSYQVGPVEEDEAPGVGLIAASIQSVKPMIFHNDPSIYCTPRRDGGEEQLRQAKIAQSALNYEWQEGGYSNEASKILDDALIFAAGIGRVTYQPTGLFVPVEDYDRDLDVEEEEEEVDLAAQTIMDRLEEMGLPIDRPQAHATLLRVSPFNWIFPAGYDEIHRMPWTAVRHLVHIDEIRNDDRFANTKGIVPDKVKTESNAGESYQGYFSPEDAEHVEVYEIWYHAYAKRMVRTGGKRKRRTVKEMRVLWISPQSGDKQKGPVVLKHCISPLDMEGYPFIDLRFERTPDKFYGLSMAAQIYPMATSIQRLIDGAVEGLEAGMALKTIYKDGIFDKTAKALLSSKRPALVPAKSKSPASDVRHLVTPAFPQEFHGVMNMLRGFMNEVGAGDEAMRGGRSSARSATEVAYRASAMKGRTESKLRTFEKFVEKVSRKTLQIMQQYYDAQRWVKISPDLPPVFWTRSDIRGEYEVGIHAGSMKPVGPEAERTSFIGFMNALGMAAQSLMAAQVPPTAIAAFYEKALALWEQDSPELRDSFAQLFGDAAMKAGGAPPEGPPEEAAIGEGAAVSPESGAPLTVPMGAQRADQSPLGQVPPPML